ncbi:MAG: GNAT family N-acetyltransferase [Candidatus Viridilinea halotolerans]|uniref:GNAT family N-acetyltransferase n=1 Tax=Candidatus Viridilinea halotolerans TaxID=2491704 RepID=A0A426UB21_9CHLR|nr:MAG: GNAT family N-acetyltransferase [Candidatus Viridilinea halotolerans]
MEILNTIDEDFWWEVAHNCSYATFYHTPLWGEIARRSFLGRYHDASFGAILARGVRVVFPLLRRERALPLPLRWLHSTFENCYGGFIADGPVSEAEALQLYQHACDWSTYTLYATDNPFGPPLASSLHGLLQPVYTEPAYILPLDGDMKQVLKRFKHGRATCYRNGLRQGVQVRVVRSLAEAQAYYASYRDAVARWGEADDYGYPWEMFEQIYYLSQVYPEQIKIWLMLVNDQIAGGRLALYWNECASLWHGSAHRDFLRYNVMTVGDVEIMRHALERGYRWFDFNTSGLKAGVMQYKERFGCEVRQVTLWRFQHPGLRRLQEWYWRVKR